MTTTPSLGTLRNVEEVTTAEYDALTPENGVFYFVIDGTKLGIWYNGERFVEGGTPQPGEAPQITSDPQFIGGSDPAQVGETLTLQPGNVTGEPTPITSWQKLHDGGDIGSPFSGNTYEIIAEDGGVAALAFEQIETNDSGEDRRVTSNSRAVDTDAPIDFTVATHLYDFGSNLNERDTEGTPTVSILRELLRGNDADDFINVNKQKQPFFLNSVGNFAENSPRELEKRSTAGIANATGGYYFGANVKFDTVEGGMFLISRNASDFGSRGDLYNTSARLPRLYLNTTDDASSDQLALSNKALTLGDWYTVEYIIDLANSVTLSITHATEAAYEEVFPIAVTPQIFPATDPFQVVLGNRATESSSLDGGMEKVIFHNDVATPALIANWRSYLQANRPA